MLWGSPMWISFVVEINSVCGILPREILSSRSVGFSVMQRFTKMVNRAMARCPDWAIEFLVMVHVYITAALFIVVEWLIEIRHPKIGSKLLKEVTTSEFYLSRGNKKTAIVTGGDGTIGIQIVRILVRLDFKVVMLAGNANKARIQSKDWPVDERRNLRIYEINLADPLRTKQYILELVKKIDDIDLVVLFGAAAMFAPASEIYDIEYHQWVNCVSQAAILHLLRPKLVSDARIVGISSVAASCAFIEDLGVEAVLSNTFGPHEAYSRSKLLSSLYIEGLNEEWSSREPTDTDLRMVSVHPGIVPGGLYRHTNLFIRTVVSRLDGILRSAELSAVFVLHTAMRNDVRSGCYYRDCHVEPIRADIDRSRRRDIFHHIVKQVARYLD